MAPLQPRALGVPGLTVGRRGRREGAGVEEGREGRGGAGRAAQGRGEGGVRLRLLPQQPVLQAAHRRLLGLEGQS